MEPWNGEDRRKNRLHEDDSAVVANIIFCSLCHKHHRYDERCKIEPPDNETLSFVIEYMKKRKRIEEQRK